MGYIDDISAVLWKKGDFDFTHRADLDEWLEYYNNQRTHQGKMCCGRTPMEKFIDGLSIYKEKKIS